MFVKDKNPKPHGLTTARGPCFTTTIKRTLFCQRIRRELN